jgi:glycosyltransferase involved in cell wall biosynthesis
MRSDRSDERPSLSVVIPAYNEAQRIAPTLRDVAGWLGRHGVSAEIIVVDDGSRDDTVALVQRLGAELGGVRVIASTPNRGKGHAVRLGMLAARGELRLYMDADNATPISELPRLVVKIDAGADVAIGSRRAPGAVQARPAPWYRRLWSRLANRVVQAGLLGGIRDTQCGFKLLTARAATEVFSRVTTTGWGFDLEALALARRLGLRIDEVAVTWSDDPRSRISPIKDAIRITREFLRIRRQMRRRTDLLPG